MIRARAVVAIAALGVAALTLPSAQATAAGGVYNVVKCHPWHIEADEIEQAGGHPSYGLVNDCKRTAVDPKIGIYNLGAAGNTSYSQFMYSAPAGTHIETVCLDHNLRRDSHHQAEILAYPGFQVLASGGDGPAGWTGQCFDLNHSQLILRLSCGHAGGCAEGLNAHAYMRNLVIALADDVDPVITSFGGELTGGGWLRGVQTLVVDASDGGSGMWQLEAGVNGSAIGHVAGPCGTGGLGWNFAIRLTPCNPNIDALALSVDTSTGPFVDGTNLVNVSGHDYGANSTSRVVAVRIDNRKPDAAFLADQNPSDPELIRATAHDGHSGMAGAQISYRSVGADSWQPLQTRLVADHAQARVNSSGVPPGEYEFKIELRDVAGNSFATTLKDDGSPMRLGFPLREPVEIRTSLGEGGSTGQVVPYGTESDVHGRLLDADGDPIRDAPIIVVDHFDNGALFPKAERPTVTDWEGRFSVPEPAGPTRSIEAVFAGTNRYLPGADEVGKFAVKGRASFKISARRVEEGTPIEFKGRVKHHGARIPAGGKLVEIQYRLKTGRQRTLKEPFRTEPDGSYRLSYRFSKALTSNALFKFRVKVRNEGNWPFKGSTSRWKGVIVRAD